MKVAVYPGSFDPITCGHLDIIERTSKIFDKIVVLIAVNPKKSSIFTTEEKVNMIKIATKHLNNVEVQFSSDLVSKFAKSIDANVIKLEVIYNSNSKKLSKSLQISNFCVPLPR